MVVEPVKPPGFHVYVDAPEPINVMLEPKHNVLLLAVIDTVGFETDTDTVLVFKQPKPLMPVTV